MTKKAKKEKKTLSLSEFQAQGSTVHKPRNALPQGPGEQVDRPFGGRGGRNRRSGGYGDSERSRADESNQWRRNSGPPRQNSGRSGFGGGFGGGRDRSFGDRERRDSRRDRDRDERSDEMFSRSAFGTKKLSGSPFGGDRNRDRDRGSFRDRSRMGNDFGRSRDETEDRGDRSKWGRQVQIRSTAGRTGRNPRMGGGFLSKRGEFDGSGKGFGAQLVADCFLPLEQTDNRRVTYANNNRTAWNQPVHQKSEEQIQKEKEREEERKRKEEEDRKEKEEKRKQREAKQKREEEKRKKEEQERKRKEAEEKRVSEMRNAVMDMMTSSEDVVQLSAEQCEVVVPTLECANDEEASRIGAALGMSVHNEVVVMSDAISVIPENSHDLILATMFSTIMKRTGEAKFLKQIDENEVNFETVVRNPDDFEQHIKSLGLNCLLGGEEDDGKFEEAFSQHINLKELNALLGVDPISASLRQRIFTYVCDEFFTNRDVKNPSAFFDDVDFFLKITTSESEVLDFIDVLIESWFNNGKADDVLVNLFDHFINADIVPSFLVVQWNMDSDGNMAAKMKALVSHCDFRFKVEDEVYDGENFAAWIAQVDSIYPELEEEDDYYDENAI